LLARRLFALAHAPASGTLRLVRTDGSTAPLYVELERGWVHGVELSPAYSLIGDAPERGEDRLKELLRLAEAAYRYDTFVAFSEGARPDRYLKRGACAPFHPAGVLRNHLEARDVDPVMWRARVGGGRVQLTIAPHPSCLGADERPLAAYLSRPRALAEIDAAGLCPPERTARLLAFLDAAGALVTLAVESASAYAVLELPETATVEEVKRAYRRLARELHPDLHPHASEDDLRDLERRFAEVSAAYRKLV
jgi:hypothetical protein